MAGRRRTAANRPHQSVKEQSEAVPAERGTRMSRSFKRSLFGYNRKQVDSFAQEMDKQMAKQQEGYEQRIKQVAEENIRLAVELNVARSGYKDAAELMVAAQSRVRDLERYLEAERLRVTRLDHQILNLKKSQPIASVASLIESLKERITVLEQMYDKALKEQEHCYGDGTRFEMEEFVLPQGIDMEGAEEDNARGFMQRLYRLRNRRSEP